MLADISQLLFRKIKNQTNSDSNEKATLGDLDALADLKEKMEKK